MLVEPELDAGRLALDTALAKALGDRVAAGPIAAPDAEALALRQALTHAWTPADEAVVQAVWGRLAVRSGAPLIVAGADAALLVADRHGLSFRRVADAEAALAEAGKGARAVIEIGARPWWAKLLARPDLRVIAALPDDRRGTPRALVVSAEASGPTGDDRTFWVTDSPLPDGRIVEALSAAGLSAAPLASGGGLKLFVLAGYVQSEDGRLSNAPGSLSGVIGSAPLF